MNKGSEVVHAESNCVQLNKDYVSFLKDCSLKNARGRMRLCAHQSVEDLLHEMIIVHERQAYVRPHRHLGKSESVHIIEGEVDVVLFDEKGDLIRVVEMGEFASDKTFYYRSSGHEFHTLIIRSDVLVFHEVTNGPFCREDTEFAQWSPTEEDPEGQRLFLEQLHLEVWKYFERLK